MLKTNTNVRTTAPGSAPLIRRGVQTPRTPQANTPSRVDQARQQAAQQANAQVLNDTQINDIISGAFKTLGNILGGKKASETTATTTTTTTTTTNDEQTLQDLITKQFGSDFEMPSGYTASMDSSGNLVVKNDKTGATLNATELEELKVHNSDISPEDEVDEIFKECGKSGENATLTKEELGEFIVKSLSLQGIDESKIDKSTLEASLKIIDADNDNQITRAELSQNLEKAMEEIKKGMDVDSEEYTADDMLADGDLDGNEKIDKEEFNDFKQSASEIGLSNKYTQKSFDELDKNHDSFLTKDELN